MPVIVRRALRRGPTSGLASPVHHADSEGALMPSFAASALAVHVARCSFSQRTRATLPLVRVRRGRLLIV
jgi:hypothetical protein